MAKSKRSGIIPIDKNKDHLGSALKDIEKKFGEGALMKLNDENRAAEVPAISTGSLTLDIATGVGGVPRGRIVEIYGPESSGKTTLALHVIANAQKAGGTAAFIDAEHALDPSYSAKLGVNIDELLVSQPSCGEDALEITALLVASNAVDVIVVDSVAALVPRSELEGQMGDSQMGVQARLMSQAMRKLTGLISRTRCCVIFINQIRMKIGVMFGSPETTTGGQALKFYTSMRLDVRRTQSLRDKEEVIGNQVRVKVAKNKVAAPFKKAEFEILFDSGISREGEILDLGDAHDILKKAGAWYSYGETRLGNGREAARQFLKDNPDLADEIADAIQVKVFGPDWNSDAPAGDSEEESLTKAS